jgi:PAS domain S-box-containing protein
MLGVSGGLTFIALLWLAFGESFGWFATVPLFRDPLNLFYLSVLTVLMAVTVLAVDLLSSNLRKTIEVARHEIEERRKAQQALDEEKSLFDAVMDRLPDQIYFKDRMSRFIRASRSHAVILGLDDPSQEIGKSDADYFAPDHARKALNDEQRILSTGEPLLDIEEKLTYPDRPDSWVVTSKVPLRDAGGRIVGTFGISHDITERKLLETRNQILVTLVDSSDDAIVGTDLERRITAWNKGAERMYGYSAAEMIGSTFSPLIPPEEEEGTRTMRERVMRGEQVTNFETTRLRKDGSKIIVSMTLSAIRDPEGKIVGMASTARDITEQKAVQAAQRRAERLESLATLTGGIAHQFNNITAVISGYLQILQSEKDLPPRPASYVEAAYVGVQRAAKIIERLLVLTEREDSSESVRLDVLVRGALSLHQKRIEDEKVRLVLDIVETPLVAGSEKRLGFVFAALIGNALDSLLDRPERRLCLRTGSTEKSVHFAVEDSGCGIPEEDMPRIFTPFFTAKGEWAPRGSPQARLKGIGLDLAISVMAVSEYGGRIDVQSTKEIGSTFRVVMPLAS